MMQTLREFLREYGWLMDDEAMRKGCKELMERVEFELDPDQEVQYLSTAHCQIFCFPNRYTTFTTPALNEQGL